jgi:hypothetical protein
VVVSAAVVAAAVVAAAVVSVAIIAAAVVSDVVIAVVVISAVVISVVAVIDGLLKAFTFISSIILPANRYVTNPKVTAENRNMKNNMHLILIQENIPPSSLLLLCNDRLDDFLK